MVANNDVDGEGRRSERRRAAIIRDGWMMGWGKARKKSSERGGETEVDGDPGRLYVHSTAQYSRCIHRSGARQARFLQTETSVKKDPAFGCCWLLRLGEKDEREKEGASRLTGWSVGEKRRVSEHDVLLPMPKPTPASPAIQLVPGRFAGSIWTGH